MWKTVGSLSLPLGEFVIDIDGLGVVTLTLLSNVTETATTIILTGNELQQISEFFGDAWLKCLNS